MCIYIYIRVWLSQVTNQRETVKTVQLNFSWPKLRFAALFLLESGFRPQTKSTEKLAKQFQCPVTMLVTLEMSTTRLYISLSRNGKGRTKRYRAGKAK